MMPRQLLVLAASLLAASVHAAITFTIQPEHCAHADGKVSTTVTGGVPPYTYSWSNGATTEDLIDVPAGTYTLTVTDFLGADQQNTAVVPNQPFWEPYTGYEAIPTCDGSTAGYVLINNEGLLGPPPHAFSGACDYFVQGSTPGYPWDFDYGASNIVAICSWGVPGSTYTTGYTDATGCPGSIDVPVPPSPEFDPVIVLSVNGSCAGGNNGSATIYSPPEPEYIYWAKPKLFNPGWVENAMFSNSLASNWTYGSTYEIPGLAPGTYAFVRRLLYDTDFDYLGFNCGDTTYFSIEDLGPTCGEVAGTVAIDATQNCALNFQDVPIPELVLEFTPGPYYATTNSNGEYAINLPLGTYTVTQQTALYDAHCLPDPVTINVAGNTTLHLLDTALQALDMQLAMASGPARPGFELHYAIDLDNLTGGFSNANGVVMTFDPVLSFISSSPAPSNVGAGTITWNNIGGMSAFQQRDLLVRLQVPPDVGLLGTVLQATATVTPNVADVTPANNSAIVLTTVTGSYDPNDKLAHTSSGNTSVWQIGEDEWIDYTIRFQNTGTDTAFHVIITDTLPPNLDPGSIVWGAASHTHTRQVIGQGVLKFIFLNILLPDSNVNEPLSHGFVSFRIRPRLPLLPGDAIVNIANIYFDFNPPVITEPSVLVAELSTGGATVDSRTLLLAPIPADDQLRVSSNRSITAIQVFAMDGREELRLSTRSTSTTLNVGRLSSGAYLLLAHLEDGTVLRQRFLKQ